MTVYQLNWPWSGRWREQNYILPSGGIVVSQADSGELHRVPDLETKRSFVLEADMVAYLQRDSPGVLSEVELLSTEAAAGSAVPAEDGQESPADNEVSERDLTAAPNDRMMKGARRRATTSKKSFEE